MKAYLFGWNPVKWKWADIDADIAKLKAGDKLEENWSVASHKTIQPGDRAYFVRLGLEPKGIFASGYISSKPYPAFRNGRHYHRINIEFDVLLNPDKEPILTMDILKTGNLAEQTWSPQASGISIRANLVDDWKAFGSVFSTGIKTLIYKKRPAIDQSLLLNKLLSKAIAHSERRLFTGLAMAAFMACTLTVSTVMSMAPAKAAKNTHHEISVRYLYPFSQLCK